MSEAPRGPGHLRPVTDTGEATARAEPHEGTGLTPPTRRGGPSRFIADVIVELGFADRERVEAAVEESRKAGKPAGQVLLEAGAITADQLARALAERFGLDYADLTIYSPDLGATNLITPEAARRFSAVPIGFDDDETLIVAMADPANVLALDDMKLLTGHELRPAVATPEDIDSLIFRMSRLDDAVAEAIEEDGGGRQPRRDRGDPRVGRGRACHKARELRHRPGGGGGRLGHPHGA